MAMEIPVDNPFEPPEFVAGMIRQSFGDDVVTWAATCNGIAVHCHTEDLDLVPTVRSVWTETQWGVEMVDAAGNRLAANLFARRP